MVRHRSQEYSISESELELGVRQGAIPLDAQIRYRPWTGGGFLPVWQVSALKDASMSPYAQLVDHLRKGVFPWASTLLFFGLIVIGLFQFRGWMGADVIQESAIGWSNSIANGKWWTAWVAHAIHLDEMHLIGNAVILFYCSFRVERAFGFWSVLLTLSMAMLCGNVLIILVGQEPVVGSSVLVFGLWAAQVAIGFRLAETLPMEFRGSYGWGNFFVFVPMLLLNFMSTDVSHLGHLGGMLGGALIGFMYTSESMIPLRQRRAWKRLLEVVLCHGFLAVLVSFCSVPFIASFPEEAVDRKEAGVIVQLPSRMEIDSWNSMTVWRSYPDEENLFFADSFWLSTGRLVTSDDLRKWWAQHLDTEIGEPSLTVAPKEGWQDHFFQSEDRIVWERVQQEGSYLVRTGCLFQKQDMGRLRICQYWLEQIYRREPLELEQARLRHERFAQTPEAAFEYASIMRDYGKILEVDEIYEQIAYRKDKYRWRALFEKLLLRLAHPDHFSWQDDQNWMSLLFRVIPVSEERLFDVALRYAKANQQCDVIDKGWDRWRFLTQKEDPSFLSMVKRCREE